MEIKTEGAVGHDNAEMRYLQIRKHTCKTAKLTDMQACLWFHINC